MFPNRNVFDYKISLKLVSFTIFGLSINRFLVLIKRYVNLLGLFLIKASTFFIDGLRKKLLQRLIQKISNTR